MRKIRIMQTYFKITHLLKSYAVRYNLTQTDLYSIQIRKKRVGFLSR